jgi:hypothetical protein
MSETETSADGEALPDLLIPANNPTDAINFALGALDMVCMIAATVIGRGMFEPSAFQNDARRHESHWTSSGNHSRAAAAKLFGQRLKEIERTKLKANAHLVVTNNRAVN